MFQLSNEHLATGARGDRRATDDAELRAVQIHVTTRCNLRCRHCYLAAGSAHPDEFDLSEWLRALDGFPETVTSVEFTGGEPLSVPWLFDLAERLRDRSIELSLFTNATLMSEEAAARVGMLFSQVYVSIDGLEEDHDRFRGMTGAFRRTIEGVEALSKTSASIGINVTLTAQTLPGLGSLLIYLSSLDVDMIRLARVMPFGRSEEDFLPTASGVHEIKAQIEHAVVATSEEVDWELVADLPVMAPTSHLCGAAVSSASIRPNGDVFPCSTLADRRFRAGSVRDHSLSSIWHAPESELFLSLREATTADITAACPRDCPGLQFCSGGCRAVAFLNTGNFRSTEPYLCAMLRDGLASGLLSAACAGCAGES
jgi:radical SAM protein with 4Fe4S-binding SPASM domain